MNIPLEVAQAQGHHGVKGAAHGIKGGRPRLALSDEERLQRRRDRQLAYRRRKGIMPREVLTWEERRERSQIIRAERFNEEYRRIWGKLPGEALTAEEFAKREHKFRAWVRARQKRNCPLHWPVREVRRHFREERRRQRAEEFENDSDGDFDDAYLQLALEWEIQAQINSWVRQYPAPLAFPSTPSPPVGRNQPCPCGSGRKFKKCCGP